MKPSLRDLLNANFPVISINTTDTTGAETVVRRVLEEIAERRQPLFGRWTFTRFLEYDRLIPAIDVEGVSLTHIQKKLLFNQALEFIRDYEEPLVILFYHCRGMLNQMQAVQLLIDTAEACKTKFSTVIFIGNGFEIPVELASIVQVFDMALPTKAELIDIALENIVVPNLGVMNLSSPNNPDRYSIADLKEKILEMNQDMLNEVGRAAMGLDPIAAENAFALSGVMTKSLDPDIVREQKRQMVRRSDVLEFLPLEESMDNVGGYDNYIEWLNRRVGAYSDEAKSFGVTAPKGVLFVGPSGNGKSLCAKATAATLKLPLLRFDMSKVFASLVGQSESRMANALKVAEAIAPCCLWLDELEKGISGSRTGDHDSGVTARVVGQFLQWRAETTAEVFVCCTSNNIHAIPPEFYRPGRIDAIFYTGMPDTKSRIEILAIHLRKRMRNPSTIALMDVAIATDEFTGAEIELVVVEGIFTAYGQGKIELTTEMLVEAARRIVPQSRRNKEEMQELENWSKDRAIPVSITNGGPVRLLKHRSINA